MASKRWGRLSCWLVSLATGSAVLASAVPPLTAPLAAQTVAATSPVPTEARPADHVLDPRVVALSARPVRLDVHDVPLADALDTLAAHGKLTLTYAESLVEGTPPVTAHFTNVPVAQAFRLVLRGLDLHVVIAPTGRATLVRGAEVDDGTITGRVVDSVSGAGIPQVTVAVKGLRLSVVTDAHGNFTIPSVPTGTQTLTIRLLGYRATTQVVQVPAGATATVRIALASTANMLTDVVTTATGRQRKLEVGNDITTINADSVMRAAPIMSVTDLLQGRVPGLVVQRTSGVPGDPARIRIRGTGSINSNNDPIVIVDGMRMYAAQSDARNANMLNSDVATPSPLDQIDPNSIATIDVLKGPSASALYGSDAANGVIVITTKKGRPGTLHWDAAASTGVQYYPDTWPEGTFVFGSPLVGPALVNSFSINCAGLASYSCRVDSVVSYQALNDPRATVLGRGNDQSLSLTVSGGNNDIQYSFTGSQQQTLGLEKLDDLDKEYYAAVHNGIATPHWMDRPDQYAATSGNGRMTIQATPTFNVALSTQLLHSQQDRSGLDGGIQELQGVYLSDQTPLAALVPGFTERRSSEMLHFMNALQLQWQPTSWLAVNGNGGFDRQDRTDLDWLLQGQQAGIDSIGFYGTGGGLATTKSATLQATIPWRWIQTAVGFSYNSSSTHDQSAMIYGLAAGQSSLTGFSNTTPSVNIGSTDHWSQSSNHGTTYGWYLAPTFALHNHSIFFSPGIREDGNNSAGSAAKTTAYPKMDASWLVSNESFFPFKAVFDQFRLRGALGWAGVQPDVTNQLRLFSADTAGGMYTGGVQLSTLGNTKLAPERSQEFEGGFDAGLFDSRLQISVTGANKVRHNAIISVPVAPSVYGNYENMFVNIGEVSNTSLETELDAQLLQGQLIGWTVNAQFTRSRNKLVRLAPGQSALTVQTIYGYVQTRDVPGYPLNGTWSRPILGYSDANGDGIIESNEVVVGDSAVFVGGTDPTFQTNFSSNWTLWHGRISVNTAVSYVAGSVQADGASSTANYLCQLLPSACLTTIASPLTLAMNNPNAPLGVQAVAVAPTGWGQVQTVNTFRWQSISVGFDLGPTVARLLHSRSVMLALQGSNLGVWSSYRGVDPDVNRYVTGNLVSDFGELPQPRTWSLRLSLGN